MRWSEELFQPVFQRLLPPSHGGASGGMGMGGEGAAGGSAGGAPPPPPPPPPARGFRLVDHDYAIGDLKVGGNAQAVTRQRWVHHTSWLWDWRAESMALLSLPAKRPAWRRDRAHDAFVGRLSQLLAPRATDGDDFLDAVIEHVRETAAASGGELVEEDAAAVAADVLPRATRRSNAHVDFASFGTA
jgi:hypothetical protein